MAGESKPGHDPPVVRPRRHQHRQHRHDLRDGSELRQVGFLRTGDDPRFQAQPGPDTALHQRLAPPALDERPGCGRLAHRFFELSFAEGQHQVSEEVQLIGDLLDSRLKLVAGLYYFNEGGYIHDFVTFGGGLLQVDGPNTLNTTSYAGYLHLDYKLTDQIGLTLGGRESSDRKTFTGGQQDLNGFFQRLIGGCYAGYPATPTPACQAT